MFFAHSPSVLISETTERITVKFGILQHKTLSGDTHFGLYQRALNENQFEMYRFSKQLFIIQKRHVAWKMNVPLIYSFFLNIFPALTKIRQLPYCMTV